MRASSVVELTVLSVCVDLDRRATAGVTEKPVASRKPDLYDVRHLQPGCIMRMTSISGIALVLGLAAATQLQAQIPASEYTARRDSLAAHLGDGVLVAFGARE